MPTTMTSKEDKKKGMLQLKLKLPSAQTQLMSEKETGSVPQLPRGDHQDQF